MTFFMSLGYELLKPAEKDILRKMVLAFPENVKMLKSSTTGVEYGLARVTRFWEYALFPALARIKVGCLVPYETGVFYVPADVALPRHVDHRITHRRCTIITPLNPLSGYAPTRFYPDDTAPSTSEMRLEDLPALMNTQAYHSVAACPEPRINFQVYFDRPFDEIAELAQTNRLFRRSARL